MIKSYKARSTSQKPATVAPPGPVPTFLTRRPGGKLGVIIDRLAGKTGATADELIAVTGWQRHSVLGALSRLRSRGFAMHFDAHADRKAYRLHVRMKPAAHARVKG